MAKSLRELRLKERLWASIEECLDGREVIASFNGQLLRIANLSRTELRPGQKVQLMVESLHPLQFRLVSAQKINSRIDIQV